MIFGFRQHGNSRSIYRNNFLASKQKGVANSALKGCYLPRKYFFLSSHQWKKVKLQCNHMMVIRQQFLQTNVNILLGNDKVHF